MGFRSISFLHLATTPLTNSISGAPELVNMELRLGFKNGAEDRELVTLHFRLVHPIFTLSFITY